MPDQLSPRQFAEAIGVSESSVRRWADDGQIRITRTAGGHRRIARREAIRFIREQASPVIRPDLLELGEITTRPTVASQESQPEELGAALEQGQANVVFGLIERMYVRGVSAAEICDGPIRHAMQKIGTLWPDDERAILIEHRATSVCISALDRLRGMIGLPNDERPLAVGGAPENDPYVLPSLMVSTVFAEVGFNPVNLGPNTPLDVLAKAACEMGARLAWVSTTAKLPKTKQRELLQNAADLLHDHDIELVIGGQAVSRDALPAGDHVHLFNSLSEMAGFAKFVLRHEKTQV